MVEFGGWEMPVQYISIVEEHHAVRRRAGLFDISHMGRINFEGPGAVAFLDRLLTNHVATLKPGQIRYSLICNESGGVLDDVLVYRTPAVDRTDHMLVVNASNRLKILDWIRTHHAASDQVEVVDRTMDWGMIALQGPRALEIVEPLVQLTRPGGAPDTAARLDALKYYTFAGIGTCGSWGLVSRTGYTGEDGVELIVPAEKLVELTERLLAAGTAVGLAPCGLGARDTLRLEAAMPLYGHELSEEMNPFTAGLDFAVKLDKPDFIGRAAQVEAKANPNRPRRVGIKLDGRRIAREGALLFVGDRQIGRVTSGTFSPTLEAPIAMAYVEPAHATVGSTLDVDFRGQRLPAQVVSLPFYRRAT
jgi:aminomethyltransferase